MKIFKDCPLWLYIYIKNKLIEKLVIVTAWPETNTDLPGTTSGFIKKLTQLTITNMKLGR